MPVTIQWVCDRDGTTISDDGPLPPAGWATLNCSVTNEMAGIEPASLTLCPVCVEAMAEWLGKPLITVAAGRSVVPIETDGAPGDRKAEPSPPAPSPA